MFSKILIANRGEIACRIIKTAQRLGINTVAVYSDADTQALHVSMADEAINIGVAPSSDSYLNMDRIIAAAKNTQAQAIHPGYGFLSENAEFCQLCADHHIVFIGPPITAIEAMGSKSAAKTIMEKSGIPLIPGYHGNNQDPAYLKKIAGDMGFPILLKAAAGGGGKGMRQVNSLDEFDQVLIAAKRESLNAFSDDIMLIEKYLIEPRHVEIQVFFDQHNHGVYLADRDCSIQRRHQKIIEEAPAPRLSQTLREKMGEAALNAARAIDYVGAGTVEFLLDKDDSFYFMEMNTRLQVEHPVTEMITGQDLVEWQFRVATGETLPVKQSQICIKGHAFEARIYAEDPQQDFLPATGTLNFLQTPQENKHVRIDTGVRQGDEISVYYDPMIAKLIVWDEDRNSALQRLKKALTQYHIGGVTTNLKFLHQLASSPSFSNADLDTRFIENNKTLLFNNKTEDITDTIPLAALAVMLKQQQQAQQHAQPSSDPYSPWNHATSWRSCEPNLQQLTLRANEQEFKISIEHKLQSGNSDYQITANQHTVSATGFLVGNQLNYEINARHSSASFFDDNNCFSLWTQDSLFEFEWLDANASNEEKVQLNNSLTAPMNGTIIDVLIKAGQQVKKNEGLMVMEAMKMEHIIRAPNDGTVTIVYFNKGDLVNGGIELLAFDED